jgi:hypothetical protein
MAEQLQPMPVNPGDPITSELLANIVSNINIINNLSNSINDSGSSTQDPGAGVQTQIESGRLKITANKDGKTVTPVSFKKPFSARPNIVCTVWQPSSVGALTNKFQPIVTVASAEGFSIQMQNVGATASGSLYVQWIACSTT